MRGTVPVVAIVALSFVLAGCFGPDPGLAPGGSEGEKPSGKKGGGFTGAVSWFGASVSKGQAPLPVEFQYLVSTDDPAATWVVDFGDGATRSGTIAQPSGTFTHTFTTGGLFKPTITLSFAETKMANATVAIDVAAPFELPDPSVFEYGASLGCVGDFATCVSFELGPDQPPIDGFWQELDERYWRLEFVATVEGIPWDDTDCFAVDADGEPLGTDLNGGSGPCGGTLPPRTAYLFLYSYAVPAPALKLEFLIPSG